LTDLRSVEVNVQFLPETSVEKRQGQVITQVRSLLDTRGTTAARAKPQEIFKEVAKRRKDIRGRTKSLVACPPQALDAVAIVELAFLGIAEHLIGFGCLLEFLLGGFVSRIPIWVVL
jgi:hypothetical protein